jgi:hypothetical protein
VLAKDVPLQLYMDAPTLQGLTGVARDASKAAVILSFLLKLLLGGPIRRLFDAIRKVSIMVHLLIINVPVPANVQYFFAGLLSFIRFDIINVDTWLRPLLQLYDDDVPIDNMWHLGYHSNYFLLNIGNLGLLLDLLLILLLLYVATMRVKNERVLKWRGWLTKGLVWNHMFMFFTELYFVFCVSTLTNLVTFRFDTYGMSLNTNLALLMVPVLLGILVFVAVFLPRNTDSFRLSSFFDTYGYLYETLDIKRGGRHVLLDPLWYYLRVITLTLALLLLQ